MSAQRLVGIDAIALANVAQWLEVRGDPLQSAQEIRAMLLAARPCVDPSLADQLYRALMTNGAHTCGVHKVAKCGMCEATAAYLLALK